MGMSGAETISMESIDQEDEYREKGRPLTVLVLGRSGSGKSATANTILCNSRAFETSDTIQLSNICQMKHGKVLGRKCQVFDVPEFPSRTVGVDKARMELRRCFQLAPDGIDAFLWTVKYGHRFSELDEAFLQDCALYFGPKFYDFALLVVTHADLFDKNNDMLTKLGKYLKTQEDYIDEQPFPLFNIVKNRLKSRFVFIDNCAQVNSPEHGANLKRLIQVLDDMNANCSARYDEEDFTAALADDHNDVTENTRDQPGCKCSCLRLFFCCCRCARKEKNAT